MIDKILDNVWWIILTLLFVYVAGSFYYLGSEAKANRICDQLGGMYVQTWNQGYKCVMITEIPLK